jgi:hypothetical protein
MGILKQKNSSLLKALFILLLFIFQSYSILSVNQNRFNSKEDKVVDEDYFRNQVVQRRNELFRYVINSVEERLRNIQIKKTPSELFWYKMNFKKMIMERSIVSNNSKARQNFLSYISLSKSNLLDFSASEKPETFLNGDYVKNISEIPTTGEGAEPWSSTYWAMRNGLISARYDRTASNTIGEWEPKTQRFTRKYNYTESISKYKQPDEFNSKVRAKQNIEKYINDNFSPSEKWDMLFLDTQFTMTNWMRWKSNQYVKNGDIPSWYGICHGWSPASYYFKRPCKPVTLYAADGKTKITFLPDDIKALASQYWANTDYKTRFIGTTCPYDDPTKIQKDSSTGLYTDPKCTSLDPGALLIILGNQMGIKKLNFVFDPNPDGEIWNQPVKSYSVDYYNLNDNFIYTKPTDNYLDVKQLSTSKDLFLKFVGTQAPPDAVWVVGAYFQIVYGLEVEASKTSQSLPNAFRTGEYLAAIYLDKNKNIIGGRWKYNTHPNFAWKYEETIPSKGLFDDQVKTFNGSVSNLKSVAGFAKKAAQYGQPLLKVVEYLVEKSACAPIPTPTRGSITPTPAPVTTSNGSSTPR